jgi:Ser/Thr protein kinase RdoA (MazF antagonist)
LIETVARIHSESEALARVRSVPTFTLASAGGAVLDAWERARDRLRPAAPTTPAIQRWILAGERSLRPAIRDLASAPEIYRGTTVIGHGDLWPAHVLWTRPGSEGGSRRRLSGIVDWADAAAGSPLLDLAQLVTHFGGWTAASAEDAIGTYAAVRRLGPDERRLLPAAAVLDLVAEAGWLLTVAYGDGQPSEPLSTALRDAIDEVVTSLEHASAVALRGDRPSKPAARRWVHRPTDRPTKRRDQRGAADSRPTKGRNARTERRRDGRGSDDDSPSRAPS